MRALVLGLILLAAAAAAGQETVRRVEVRGNLRVETDLILQKVSSRGGEAYDPAKIRADVAAIYSMGFFEDIAVEFGPTGTLVFVVLERPALREWRVEGSEAVEKEDMEKAVPLKRREIVDQDRVEEGARGLRTLFREKGFYLAEVRSEVEPVPDGKNHVDVVYRVDEGEKVRIKDLNLAGVVAGDETELRKYLATRPASSWSWITGGGTFKEADLARDQEVIRSYYLNRGHVAVQVQPPLVSLERDRKWIRIDIPVVEGDVYRIAGIHFSGDLDYPEAELRSAAALSEGEIFRSEDFRRAVQKLTDLYGERGYAFAEVEPRTQLDREARTIALEFAIHKGPPVRIGRIEIRGNTKTRDRVVRREMALAEGQLYQGSLVQRSRRRIENLGFFEKVNFSTHRRPGTDLLDVDIEVEEKPTGSFSVGAGYSSVDKIIGMANVSQRNFLGLGYQLALNANLSVERSTYSFTFNNPRVFDSRVYAGVDFWKSSREFTDYDKDSIGGALKTGLALNDEWSTRYIYRLEDADVKNVDPDAAFEIREQEGRTVTSSVTAQLNYDSRDNRWEPHSGTSAEWSAEAAGGLLQGDAGYLKFGFDTTRYWPLWFRHVFSAHGRIGYIHEYQGELPVYERYYLGGINTVRGYSSGSISPLDEATGDEIGGNKELLFNLEYVFPILEEAKIRGLFFFDAGNAWDEGELYNFNDLRKSVGLGVRWLSPMGPLRLEWGYALDAYEGDETNRWEFSIGGFL